MNKKTMYRIIGGNLEACEALDSMRDCDIMFNTYEEAKEQIASFEEVDRIEGGTLAIYCISEIEVD